MSDFEETNIIEQVLEQSLDSEDVTEKDSTKFPPSAIPVEALLSELEFHFPNSIPGLGVKTPQVIYFDFC